MKGQHSATLSTATQSDNLKNPYGIAQIIYKIVADTILCVLFFLQLLLNLLNLYSW